jgi:hypothetical protein
MPLSGCSIIHVEAYHGPNAGRIIINDNFDCLENTIDSLQVASATGSTIVTAGTYTTVSVSFSGNVPVYQVDVIPSAITFTNATATPTTIGGISAGSTFSNKTMTEMWNALLYPYQTPAFTSFSRTNLNSTYELGEVMVAGSQTFTWSTSNSSNVSANTITIVQNIAPVTTLLSNSANDGTEIVVTPTTYSAGTSSTVTLYTITAYNSLNSPFSTTISRSWRPRIYYGTSLTTPLVEANIEALANNPLASGFAGTYSFAAGGYKYFCYPSSFGTATVFTDTGTNFNVPMEPVYVVSVTNIYGVTANYNVHRSTNILGGSINIQIS